MPGPAAIPGLSAQGNFSHIYCGPHCTMTSPALPAPASASAPGSWRWAEAGHCEPHALQQWPEVAFCHVVRPQPQLLRHWPAAPPCLRHAVAAGPAQGRQRELQEKTVMVAQVAAGGKGGAHAKWKASHGAGVRGDACLLAGSTAAWSQDMMRSRVIQHARYPRHERAPVAQPTALVEVGRSEGTRSLCRSLGLAIIL